LHDRSSRLTPNDFAWHSYPEPPATAQQGVTHIHRAYQEKSSGLFDRPSPQTLANHLQTEKQARLDDMDADAKRRANVYYSDLFGRACTSPEASKQERRPRHQGTDEDKLTVHQDWTDAKTELLQRSGYKHEDPARRKCDELHQARIFGQRPSDDNRQAQLDRETTMSKEELRFIHDNSEKVKPSAGMSLQQVHQAHLRTSTMPEGFYKTAEDSRQWEVIELHISGFSENTNDDHVRKLCSGFDLQLVKVCADVDPVRNLCKGRAKVIVRYNPKLQSVEGLLRKLEGHNLRVEM